jgi:hypothetical protein
LATSGQTSLVLTVREIIEDAYEQAGIVSERLNGGHAERARRCLNLITGEWVSMGLLQWCVDEDTVAVTLGAESVNLGPDTIDVIECFLRRGANDTPMVGISRSDYAAIANKSTQGRPSQFFVERRRDPVNGPRMFIWNAAENATDVIHFWRIRRPSDVVTSAEDPDIPWEWQNALCNRLAYEVHKRTPEELRKPDYLAVKRDLKNDAEASFVIARDENRERADLSVRPPDYSIGLG